MLAVADPLDVAACVADDDSDWLNVWDALEVNVWLRVKLPDEVID